jgi:hypothetical protein
MHPLINRQNRLNNTHLAMFFISRAKSIIYLLFIICCLPNCIYGQTHNNWDAKLKSVNFRQDSIMPIDSQEAVLNNALPKLKNSSAKLELRIYSYSPELAHFSVRIIKIIGDSIRFQYITYRMDSGPVSNGWELVSERANIGNNITSLYKKIISDQILPDSTIDQIINFHIFDLPSVKDEKNEMVKKGTIAESFQDNRWWRSQVVEVKLDGKYRNFDFIFDYNDIKDKANQQYFRNVENILYLFKIFEKENLR